VDFRRRGPTFWRPQNDHGPTRTARRSRPARLALKLADRTNAMVQRRRHRLVHRRRIGTFDKQRRVPVTLEQAFQLLVTDARQQRRIVDLVTVQIEDRQHRTVAYRIQKLVDVPRRCEWTSFRLPISYDCGDYQIRIVESSAARV